MALLLDERGRTEQATALRREALGLARLQGRTELQAVLEGELGRP